MTDAAYLPNQGIFLPFSGTIRYAWQTHLKHSNAPTSRTRTSKGYGSPMLTKRPFARGIISLVLASALALGFSIFPIHAMGLGEEGTSGALCAAQRTDSEIDSLVSSMIASSDYMEGEAIVCCLGSEGISVQSDDEASDLLAGAETLSSVTARQYAEATGESIPAATEQGLLTAQSEGESVRILKVCDYGLTTEQLLRVLLRDSRVLSAEPNYLMSFEEDGDQDLDDVQVDMGGQDAEEETVPPVMRKSP